MRSLVVLRPLLMFALVAGGCTMDFGAPFAEGPNQGAQATDAGADVSVVPDAREDSPAPVDAKVDAQADTKIDVSIDADGGSDADADSGQSPPDAMDAMAETGQDGSPVDGGVDGSTGTCTLQTPGYPTCSSCMQTYCLAECVACSANPECVSIIQCFGGCDASACSQACLMMHPGGVDAANALGGSKGCLPANCPNECPASCSISMGRSQRPLPLLLVALVALSYLRRRIWKSKSGGWAPR